MSVRSDAGIEGVRLVVALVAALACFAVLCGCSAGSSAASSSSASSSAGSASMVESEAESEATADLESDEEAVDEDAYLEDPSANGWGILPDDLVGDLQERYYDLEQRVAEELEDRATAEPLHAGIGDEVEVTDKLAVSVVSVEPGPYDYLDDGPTVKVTVSMRNLTDKTVLVKASNWNADNTSGQRVDHKLYVKDGSGDRSTRSFLPTRVSPHATFTDVVYFDGEGLVSVIYEPHWLVSAENQYVYFDISE